MASLESSAPWYRRKTGVSNISFFHRRGVQCLKRGGFDLNIMAASVKLEASKASSCRARARIVETAQKRSFRVGVK
jgi:hypothetical protein